MLRWFLGLALMGVVGCKAEIPQANNEMTRYVSDLQSDVKRADQAVKKMNAGAGRSESAANQVGE